MGDVVEFENWTLDQKPSGHPLIAEASGSLIKPGELVDLVEVTPLNLTDWRVYNQLIANAWEKIGEPVIHKIPKGLLRGKHTGTERIEETIERLVGAIATIRVVQDGKPAKLRVQLLGANVKQEQPDGFFHYTFPATLLDIIKSSKVFARLKSHVMYALRSKYALRLYEVVQKRANLSRKYYEDFSVQGFRNLLGVPPGKLARFADFNKHAIQPALQELNLISEHAISIEFRRKGRKVETIVLIWFEKDRDGKEKALQELDKHRLGRKARSAKIDETPLAD